MSQVEAVPNHHFLVPRMALLFDASRIGAQTEFSLEVIKTDAMSATVLEPPLTGVSEIGDKSFMEVLIASEQDNPGGKLSVQETAQTITVNFGLRPLPQRAERPTDPALNYFEKFRQTLLPLREHLNGRHSIYQALAQITQLQYQYAVPPEKYDVTQPVTGARFSYRHGNDVDEPRIIVTTAFDRVMQAISRERSAILTQEAVAYFRFLDPTYLTDKTDSDVLSYVTIPGYGRFFSSGKSSVGQRSSSLTEEDIDDFDTERDYRLQPGDQYIASGHNLDSVAQPQLLVMVALGSIQRLMRAK